MRVLNSMIDPRIGGPQTRALSVALKLRNHNVETEFLLPKGENEFANKARSEGFVVHRPGLSRLKPLSNVANNVVHTAKLPLAIQRIRRIISNESIDVVHANMSMNIEAAMATRLSPASLVWHFNDVLVSRSVARLTSSMATYLADEIVVASGSVADHYFAEFHRSLNTVYAPVDVDTFDPQKISDVAVREELGIDEKTTVIGTVGNVNPVKGHEYLVRAVEYLKSNYSNDFVILIAGGTLNSRVEYYDRLQSLCKSLNVQDAVEFLGRRTDIPELLSLYDVFVLPSLAEACPIAVLEAMAMKNPVVATNVGGIPEQIEDGESGWLVPSKDPGALANAILEALQNEQEATRRGENARQTVIETFSLERCVERHMSVYEKAVSEN